MVSDDVHRRAYEFHQRHQMGRIDRMRHQAAVAAFEFFREQARDDGGGGGGENRIGCGQAVEFGKDRALGLQCFGGVFLHVAGAVERVGKRGGSSNPFCGGLRIVDEPMFLQFCQAVGHHHERPIGGAGDGVM